MLNCFAKITEKSVPITIITTGEFPQWLSEQPSLIQNWAKTTNFTGKSETFLLVPNEHGILMQVIFAVKNHEEFLSYGLLPIALPVGCYHLQNVRVRHLLDKIAIGWGLGSYQFTRYKKDTKSVAQLVLTENYHVNEINNILSSLFLVRDLINTPTEQMGPVELARAVEEVGNNFSAEVTQIIGDELLEKNYPIIHAVGRASTQAPRLIDLRWGDESDPKITLVGKGVCFDSGGLDIKNCASMLLMRKDMGGAANALGLAQMIMQAKLPLRLRLLIPAVENAIAGNAYRPGDIFTARNGMTVEIENTDAEGRLILADAIAEAVTEKPDLLLDFATLTGAARVAIGTEISALFCNDEKLAHEFVTAGQQQRDPIWQLPLYAPYRKMLDSSFADIANGANSSYAGAITAALFLQEFVPAETPWAHFDFMAWNLSSRPGRPEGGEAMAIRALFSYLQAKYT